MHTQTHLFASRLPLHAPRPAVVAIRGVRDTIHLVLAGCPLAKAGQTQASASASYRNSVKDSGRHHLEGAWLHAPSPALSPPAADAPPVSQCRHFSNHSMSHRWHRRRHRHWASYEKEESPPNPDQKPSPRCLFLADPPLQAARSYMTLDDIGSFVHGVLRQPNSMCE